MVTLDTVHALSYRKCGCSGSPRRALQQAPAPEQQHGQLPQL